MQLVSGASKIVNIHNDLIYIPSHWLVSSSSMFKADSAPRMPPTKISTNTVSKDCLIELVQFTKWIYNASSDIVNTPSTNVSSDRIKSHTTHELHCGTTSTTTNLSHARMRPITMHNTKEDCVHRTAALFWRSDCSKYETRHETWGAEMLTFGKLIHCGHEHLRLRALILWVLDTIFYPSSISSPSQP